MKMWNTLTKALAFFIVFLGICNSVLLTLSVISPHVPIDQGSIVSVLGLFFPIFFIVQIIITSIVGLLKRKVFWFLFFIVIISLPSFSKVYGFNFLSGGDDNIDKAVTVASFNMQFSKPISLLAEAEAEVQTEKFKQELKGHNDIDIMSVQEYGWRSKAIIESSLRYKYTHTIEGKTVGILSRYPIVNSGLVDFKSNIANTCLWADIVIDDDTLRCYSFHLESNRHDGHVPDMITQDGQETKTLSMMIGIVKHYTQFSVKRFSQIQMILNHVSKCDYPILLCGDLNDTPQSYNYKTLVDNYKDAFLEVGKGSGQTIESRVPLLRIDYILGSSDINFIDYKCDASLYSDHYMIKSAFVIGR